MLIWIQNSKSSQWYEDLLRC